jgi:hypothetical protein
MRMTMDGSAAIRHPINTNLSTDRLDKTRVHSTAERRHDTVFM